MVALIKPCSPRYVFPSFYYECLDPCHPIRTSTFSLSGSQMWPGDLILPEGEWPQRCAPFLGLGLKIWAWRLCTLSPPPKFGHRSAITLL